LEPWGYSTPRAMAWSLLVLVGLGMALSGWGKATLGPNYTGGTALKVEHRLVTGGPYAWLRHPIYAGAILSYAATGALSGMWVVLVLGAGVIPVAYGLRIWLDERLLSRSFGQTYAAYRHDVALLGIRLGRRSGRQ
jgi:protein-S-isoprenylcysteine O-methyltransferase Ste14